MKKKVDVEKSHASQQNSPLLAADIYIIYSVYEGKAY
jgi:hypothetical protein